MERPLYRNAVFADFGLGLVCISPGTPEAGVLEDFRQAMESAMPQMVRDLRTRLNLAQEARGRVMQ